MAVLLVGLVLWSLFAWVIYGLVDPVLGWIAVNAGLVVQGGTGVATVAGGKEVGAVLDSLDVSGLLGQIIALLRVVLKPIIVIGWAVGAIALFIAPSILSRVRGRFSRRWH